MKLGQRVKCRGYVKKTRIKELYGKEENKEYKVKEIIKEEFNGIAVEKKKINLGAYVHVWGFIKKCDYIDCYKVYYALGKSRLVPCDLCEVEE